MTKKKLPKGLVVVRAAMKGRQDSFWYEGLIATYKGFELRAVGDIDIRPNVEVPHSCKWEDVAREAKTDKGLHRLVSGDMGVPNGKNIKKYYYNMNNWFEVIPPVDYDGPSIFDAEYEYAGGIDALIWYADGEGK